MNINLLPHYNRSLLDLVARIKELQRRPFSNSNLCLEIQIQLIKKIKCIENKIRIWKKKLKAAVDDGESKHYGSMVDEYRFILYLYKAIGDCIAFIYIDRWDMKPLNFKSPSGFISNKEGFDEECRTLRQASAKGVTCLLADLTNVLRHGDLYAFTEDRLPMILEIKKSKKLNPRGIRQRNRLERLVDYLRTDKSTGFFGQNISAIRVAPTTEATFHTTILNDAVRKAYLKGSCIKMPEEGLYYAVGTREKPSFLSSAIEGCRQPIVFLLNEAKTNYSYYPYYPIMLSLRDPKAIMDFYNGNLIIVVIVDIAVVISSFKKRRIACSLLQDNDYLFELSSSSWKLHGFDGPMRVSKAFFSRAAYEFLSLKWIITLLSHRIRQAKKEIQNV